MTLNPGHRDGGDWMETHEVKLRNAKPDVFLRSPLGERVTLPLAGTQEGRFKEPISDFPGFTAPCGPGVSLPFVLFLPGLGVEPRGWCMLGKCSPLYGARGLWSSC